MPIRVALLVSVLAAGCAARSAHLPAVEWRLLETPDNGAPRERVREKLTLNAVLVGEASLGFLRPAELLKAAEGPGGGDPMKLMRAGRTLGPGEGVVLLGTARRHEAAGGSATSLVVYSLALACARADLDRPGDLQGCQGYLTRVTKAWPGEIYEAREAMVSFISEGGTAHGRLRVKSAPGGFAAEVEGEFAASIVQLQAAATLTEAR